MTLTDWLPTASGAALGLAGIVAGAWTTISGRRHERALAAERDDRAHTRAHEQWHRDRRADAYLTALDVAYGVGEWIHYAVPVITPAPEPPMPSQELQLRARAAVDAFGSSAVRAAADAWHEAVRLAHREVQFITNGGGDRETLDRYRAEVKSRRLELAARIDEELRAPVAD